MNVVEVGQGRQDVLLRDILDVRRNADAECSDCYPSHEAAYVKAIDAGTEIKM